ncbi:alpha/beta hydrolase [Aestuariivivens sediminicola]|uniref:alpha/beta hydrolase n=1 Tax=Aestuariivivens sediminicola TaxID=2913560 RepID=UPI001F55F9F0|nr:alpha/beta fold hydrolase [Aestuariivivens sediminicola]
MLKEKLFAKHLFYIIFDFPVTPNFKLKFKSAVILFCGSVILCHAQTLRNPFNYPKKIDYADEVVFRTTMDTTRNRFEKIVINGSDSKVPFFHYINKDNKNRFVFVLNGIGSSKDDWRTPNADGNLVDSLVNLGYDVIIPDARYHGERSYEYNFRPADVLPRGISHGKRHEDANGLYQVYNSTIKDLRIIMDFLEMKYTSTDLQFDFIGYSMGGAISLILNAIDKRVNSVVAFAAPVNAPLGSALEAKNYIWPGDIMNRLKDVTPKFYSRFIHAPTSLLMGRTDPITSEQAATEFYDNIPLKDKNLKFYEAGHALPADYINDATEWITMHNKK